MIFSESWQSNDCSAQHQRRNYKRLYDSCFFHVIILCSASVNYCYVYGHLTVADSDDQLKLINFYTDKDISAQL